MFLQECVRSLLNRDPARRPTAKQILHCSWLQQQHLPDKPIDSVVITRMRHFAAMNKFKKAALLAVAKSLSPHEIDGLERLFKSIDADSSGTITVDELKAALKRMGSDVQVLAIPPSCCLILPLPGELIQLPDAATDKVFLRNRNLIQLSEIHHISESKIAFASMLRVEYFRSKVGSPSQLQWLPHGSIATHICLICCLPTSTRTRQYADGQQISCS